MFASKDLKSYQEGTTNKDNGYDSVEKLLNTED